jgi:hypothetical protein
MVRPLVWSDDRCGHVMAQASDPETASLLACKAAAAIRIITEPVADADTLTMAEYLAEVEEELDPFTR